VLGPQALQTVADREQRLDARRAAADGSDAPRTIGGVRHQLVQRPTPGLVQAAQRPHRLQ
jgi:hypothetical protein